MTPGTKQRKKNQTEHSLRVFTTKTEFERVRARDGKGESDLAKMFSDDLSDKGLLSKIDKEHKLKRREKKQTTLVKNGPKAP